MVALHLFFMLLGTALASACVPQAPQWICSEHPHISVEFSDTTITGCDEKYIKTLFLDIHDVSFTEVDENKSYTLIMVDPDAPGSKKGQGWLHLIKSSIPGTELAGKGNFNGSEVTAYTKPTPPKNSGTHRYFLYLYEEPKATPVMEGVTKRANFNIQEFASKYSLCGPVAMNMFVTEY